MKIGLVLFTALAFGSVAFSAESSVLQATPAASVQEGQKLDKFMVTGSLETPANTDTKLEKFMVTGSLASEKTEESLPKFMVTGSLETPATSETKLEKFMVTGSMEFKPTTVRHFRK